MTPLTKTLTSEHPRGPRMQFRLRTLLVVTAVAALLLAWHRQAKHQQESVERLLGSNPNAGVYFAHQFDDQGRLDRKASPPEPEWLRRFTGVRYLASVSHVDLQYATDAELQNVAQLSNLERLTLVRAVDITDVGLASLRGLKKLRVLKLYDADLLTDAALGHLAHMRSLERVTFGPRPRHVTQAALARLRSALPHCRIEVTDEEGDESQLLSQGQIG